MSRNQNQTSSWGQEAVSFFLTALVMAVGITIGHFYMPLGVTIAYLLGYAEGRHVHYK